MSNKDKRESPLVKSVLALDEFLTELERVGTKITSIDLTSDFDVEYVQKLMTRFAECGQGITKEVSELSAQLYAAQAQAGTIAQDVSKQAEVFRARAAEQNEKLEQFRILGEKVRELNTVISRFRPAQGADVTEKDRAEMISSIPAIDAELAALISELQTLRESARNSKMKALEKSVESLAQSLQAARERLSKHTI